MFLLFLHHFDNNVLLLWTDYDLLIKVLCF